MKSFNNLFATLAALFVLAFAFSIVAPTKASAYDCILSGVVYDNSSPSAPVIGATVTAMYYNRYLVKQTVSTTTNGNGFYEIIIWDAYHTTGFNDVIWSAMASGYSSVVATGTTSQTSYQQPCTTFAIYQLDFTAIP